ncbi:MAG: hypothetical protein AAGJ10_21290 [Bacteroidota bacterium]
MADKTYNEAEVAAMLSRAARMQQVQKRKTSQAELTIDEVKAAAAEAGIDPHLVEMAALSAVTARTQSVLGIPGVGKCELTVEQPFQRAEWPHMVDAFEAATGKEGRTIIQGTQRIWTTGLRTFTVDDLDEHTSVSFNALAPAALTWIVLCALLATGAFAAGVAAAIRTDLSAGLAALALLSVLLLANMTLRPWAKAQTERAVERASSALDQCAMLLHDATPADSQPSGRMDVEWDEEVDQVDGETLPRTHTPNRVGS